MKTTTLPLKHSMNRTPCQLGLLLIPLVLACFALSPEARAVCQDGCLTNENTALGDNALIFNTTGVFNTAVGEDALHSNTTGFRNTAIGASALSSIRAACCNTAVGINALEANTDGGANTAVGEAAMAGNTIGSYNTAVGDYALVDNTTGVANTAVGTSALAHNISGDTNTANGQYALYLNTTGNNNTANGTEALESNSSGSGNTATGGLALLFSTGDDNTANGFHALFNNTTGSNNIGLGNNAGANLTTGANNIDIGNAGVASEAGIIRIGTTGTQTATFIAGIRGVPISGGTEVGVNASGQLGVRASSARYKDAIKPMDKASEAILRLKPVTFRYKHELDAKGIPQFGLVAEDVEKVNPELVARDDQGKPFTVRYEAVNAMLLNEFLKEHRKVEQQRKDFEAALAQQQRQIDALTAGLQKVSAQLELSKAEPRTVLNNP